MAKLYVVEVFHQAEMNCKDASVVIFTEAEAAKAFASDKDANVFEVEEGKVALHYGFEYSGPGGDRYYGTEVFHQVPEV